MKPFRENPKRGGTEKSILMDQHNAFSMSQLIYRRDLKNYKVSFSNYFDEKTGLCRLCKTRCKIYQRQKDGDDFLVSDTEKPYPHRIWSRNKKLMFCKLPNGKLKIALGMSKMRDDQTEVEEEKPKGSKKSRLIAKIVKGLEYMTDDEIKKVDLPESLVSLSGLKLQEKLDDIKEIIKQ